jgi:hypothetical protein
VRAALSRRLLFALVAGALVAGALVAAPRAHLDETTQPTTPSLSAPARAQGPSAAADAPVRSAAWAAAQAPRAPDPSAGGVAAPASARSSMAPTVRVVVAVEPWAEVSVDGVRRGVTPLELQLTRGTHLVVLRNAALHRREQVRLALDSPEERRLYRSWYVDATVP